MFMVSSVCTPRLNSIAKLARALPFNKTIFCCLLSVAVRVALSEKRDVVKKRLY